ncbi:MAG: ATP-binding cassette domain-containing protein [Candidatus Syntrophonatronum acetioxidans]|uniref:ATP-binding cassette domain-containing protein n=1 Tax=Candidatus Syntrophonatronum acetioxidans TaxID=1795816 RepID=A0A424YET5_9FIRM|nr:MAG: ATP-binding cassette domain-containing protein [Candidatus Syntrophonatronum acetioxidans]
METIVKVNCLKHTYPDKTTVHFCGLDFQVNRGERVAVIGGNGSGKTTLLLHVMGLLRPTQGEVEIFGLKPYQNFHQVRKRLGVVFQNVEEQIIGPTVEEDLSFTPRNDGYSSPEIEKMLEEIMARCSITHLRKKVPHYLSGGEKRRVALAGAMVSKPELLLMDEPFSGLDPQNKGDLIELLNFFNKEYGTTLVITTHDLNLLPEIADTVYLLLSGQILFRGEVKELFQREDLLLSAHMGSPLLVNLCRELKERGIAIPLPLNPREAAEEISNLFHQGR